jgi:hypothetical protein
MFTYAQKGTIEIVKIDEFMIDHSQGRVMEITGKDTQYWNDLSPVAISIDEVIEIARGDDLKKIVHHLFYIETVVLYQLYHDENLIEVWHDEKYVHITNTMSKYANIIGKLLYTITDTVYEFHIRDNITYYKKEHDIKYRAIKDMDFDCFNLMLRVIGIEFYVENYGSDMIVYKFSTLKFKDKISKPKYSKIGYAAKLMYAEFEKQDSKILDFKIVTSDSELLLHSSIISQVACGIIKTLLDETSSIEAKAKEITFRDYNSDIIKIYIKYLYFSSDDLSSVLTFTDVFEEIKMIDSVLNFANFLDDTDFFNTIVEYIMKFPINRHINTLFQYKDMQSHNTVFQEYLSTLRIKSLRDFFLKKCEEIQELYITKLEFIGIDTNFKTINSSEEQNLIVFKTHEYGIISIVLESLNKSRRELYSIIEKIDDLTEGFLIKTNYRKENRDGTLIVPNLKKFLGGLQFSTSEIPSIEYDESYKIIRGKSYKKILKKYHQPDGNNLTSFRGSKLRK